MSADTVALLLSDRPLDGRFGAPPRAETIATPPPPTLQTFSTFDLRTPSAAAAPSPTAVQRFEAPATISAQRAPVDDTPAPPAPPPAPVQTAAAAATTPTAATAAPAGADLDDLSRRLYERISVRLKAELRLDRERAGMMTDMTG
jgi:hypothetical protein